MIFQISNSNLNSKIIIFFKHGPTLIHKRPDSIGGRQVAIPLLPDFLDCGATVYDVRLHFPLAR